METSVEIETEETNSSSTEPKRLSENTPTRFSNPKTETSPSVTVKSEEVARQIKSIKDALTQ